ncbi:Secreted lipase [Hyphodiscus hymeniophilus]|uniref:Carboxylic ester hydrolase n=1 Tax=Hyphodiscus hymeniophilus TaxID=353542 RepID=A0A9P6VG65_9HELO|nr:Secreted lipase [Hyphodiscus hymeniophilus]
MYSFAVIVSLSLLGLFFAFGVERNPSPSLVTDRRTNVTYHGVSDHGVDTFLGISYGQDTSGAGRFAPPKPFIPAQNSIINATAAGARCPQPMIPFPPISNIVSNVTDISEDCLNLRITRPSTPSKSEKLPVLVFIYGGGYAIGQIYDMFYQPDQLVKDSVSSGTPVIYVAMNYRLGIFGFPTSDLLQERKSLNLALKDQRLALDWIQENIHIFGGDPNRVTIFGESAGGTSVAAQILAYGGKQKPPFQQAIVESGLIGPGFAPKYSTKHFDLVTRQAGCDYGMPDSELSLDCLRSLSLESLLNTSLAVQAVDNVNAIGEFYTPTVDGDFIPLEPSLLVQSGQFSKVPMMLGFNRDDGTLFVSPTVNTEEDVAAVFTGLFPNLKKSTTTRILELYPLIDFPAIPAENASAQFVRASRIYRDIEFTCPSLFLGLHVSDQGHELDPPTIYHSSKPQKNLLQTAIGYLSASRKMWREPNSRSNPVFFYELNQTSLAQNLSGQGLPQLGISHLADLPYVFDEVSKFNNSVSNALLAKQITGSWSRFATSGHPSSTRGTTLKGWLPAWNGKNGHNLGDARECS